jgi:hypothetical protein
LGFLTFTEYADGTVFLSQRDENYNVISVECNQEIDNDGRRIVTTPSGLMLWLEDPDGVQFVPDPNAKVPAPVPDKWAILAGKLRPMLRLQYISILILTLGVVTAWLVWRRTWRRGALPKN